MYSILKIEYTLLLKMALTKHYTKYERLQIWEHHIAGDEVKCPLCPVYGNTDHPNIISPDWYCLRHIVSRSNGGGSWLSNLRPICGQCNSKSNGKTLSPDDFRYINLDNHDVTNEHSDDSDEDLESSDESTSTDSEVETSISRGSSSYAPSNDDSDVESSTSCDSSSYAPSDDSDGESSEYLELRSRPVKKHKSE